MTTLSGKAEIRSPQFPKASFSETVLCCTKALSRAFVDIHLTNYVQLGSFTTKWMSWGFSPLQLLSLLHIHPQYSCAPASARNVLYKHAHTEHLGTHHSVSSPFSCLTERIVSCPAKKLCISNGTPSISMGESFKESLQFSRGLWWRYRP